VVAEHDGDGRVQTGSIINVISAHAHQSNRYNTGKMYADELFPYDVKSL